MGLFKDIFCFMLVLFLSVIILLNSILFWILRSTVKLLALILKRNELDELLGTTDMFFIAIEPNAESKVTECINATITLEGKLDTQALQKDFKERVLNVVDERGNLFNKRLQQFPTVWLGYYFFKWDRSFEIKNHIYEATDFEENKLQQFVTKRTRTPFREDSPMWEIIVSRQSEHSSNTILYIRCHHSVSDGISILQVLQSIRKTPENIVDVKSENPAPQAMTRGSLTLYNKTIGLPANAYSEIKSLGYLNASKSVNTDVVPCLTSMTAKLSLLKLKEVKKSFGVPLSAIVNTAVSTALTSFVAKEYEGESKRLKHITAMMAYPIPNRPQGISNHFGAAEINLPLNLGSSVKEKIEKNRAEFMKMLESPLPLVRGLSIVLLANFPVSLFKRITPKPLGILVSNLPGPPEPTYILNHLILNMNFWISTTKHVWICFSMLSYNGSFQVVCSANADIIKSQQNLDEIRDSVENELNSIMYEYGNN